MTTTDEEQIPNEYRVTKVGISIREFAFANPELALDLWTVISGISGFDD